MKYKAKEVEAVRLTWANWDKVCELIGSVSFENGTKGCYIDNNGDASDDAINGKIGLELVSNRDRLLCLEDEWIIKDNEGNIFPCDDYTFQNIYKLSKNE